MNWLRLTKHYWQSDDGDNPSRYIVLPVGVFPHVRWQGWRVHWAQGEPVKDLRVTAADDEATKEAAMAACDAHGVAN